jgi:octaprenyl-diphosphate synthase
VSDSIRAIQSAFKDDLEKVNQVIIDSLASKEELVEKVSSYLIEAGGKRLRPILTILTSKICGYKSGDNHICLAAAVELIHAATLLHDDVIDESTTRRGKPTANFEWGNKASILVGDFLFSQSFILMVKSGSMEALDSLSKASAIIAEGEVMQLARLFENEVLSIEQYEEIAGSKTAALFSASCHVGSVIADAPLAVQNACRRFGMILGLIFQVSDDMLDYFADPKESGKNIGDDLTEGLITIPVILAYNEASNDDREKIEKIFFSNDRISKFDELKSILEAYDTKNLIADYIENYHKEALAQLELIPNGPNKEYLSDILDYAAFR